MTTPSDIWHGRWARWPWQRCKARHPDGTWRDRGHCDLRKGHTGPHVAERGIGMDWIYPTEEESRG